MEYHATLFRTRHHPNVQGAWYAQNFELMHRMVVYDVTGMALAPWGVLAGGRLRSDEEEERRAKSGENGRTIFNPNWKRNDEEKAMAAALDKVAKEVSAKHVTAVAIAYVMQKTPYVFPIIGGRKVEQLEANLEALEIVLTPEQIKYLESIVPFDPGFPNTLIVRHFMLIPASILTNFCTGRR